MLAEMPMTTRQTISEAERLIRIDQCERYLLAALESQERAHTRYWVEYGEDEYSEAAYRARNDLIAARATTAHYQGEIEAQRKAIVAARLEARS